MFLEVFFVFYATKLIYYFENNKYYAIFMSDFNKN